MEFSGVMPLLSGEIMVEKFEVVSLKFEAKKKPVGSEMRKRDRREKEVGLTPKR